MRKALTALLVASAAAFTVAYLPLAAPSFATSCDDVTFIFARGSGQSLGDTEYSTFKSEIESEMKRSNSKLKYHFYELGTSKHGDAKYPAVSIDFLTAIGAKVSAGNSFAYGESVNAGKTELKAYIKEVSSACANTKFVLGGYSQGAQIITTASDELDPEKILYVATFGDPKLYLPEGKGINPDACRGKNLSPYREYAPNCRTSAGSLGAKNPYQTQEWSEKKGLWCKDKDIICGAGISLTGGEGSNPVESMASSLIASHTAYAKDGVIASAARTIVKKLQTTYPAKINRTNSLANNRDTVILIDRTGSMMDLINDYKKEALDLAKKTLNAGGRVALYTYGELAENQKPIKLASFGDTFAKFQSAVESITVDGGGDEPESMLSALKTVMNRENWRVGATKSIIVLTDASYHSPDHDGTSLSSVINRSYEIDPVNIYVINLNEHQRSIMEQLANPTGGQVFNTTGSLSTNLLTSRPNITLPLAEYTGAPGQEFVFSALTSDEIVKYDWDLDFDGIFETTTSVPTISKTYSAVTSGYLIVKATDKNGNSSTASAKVDVKNQSAPPEITDLKLKSREGDTATISYKLSSGALLALVSINDTPLGYTSQTTLEVNDLKESAIITLTPISATGQIGTPVSLNIPQAQTKGQSQSNDGNFVEKILPPRTGVK